MLNHICCAAASPCKSLPRQELQSLPIELWLQPSLDGSLISSLPGVPSWWFPEVSILLPVFNPDDPAEGFQWSILIPILLDGRIWGVLQNPGWWHLDLIKSQQQIIAGNGGRVSWAIQNMYWTHFYFREELFVREWPFTRQWPLANGHPGSQSRY